MTYTQPTPPVPPRQPGVGSDVAPPSIKNAVWSMYAGAGLSALTTIAGIATKNRVLDDFRAKLVEEGRSVVDVNNLVDTASTSYNFSAIAGGIVAILLWILMAMMNGKGHKWARIVAAILFAINTIGMIFTFFSSPRPHAFSLVLNVLVWLAGLAAIYFLFRPESSAFFNRAAAVR